MPDPERPQFRHLTENEVRTIETVCFRQCNYQILGKIQNLVGSDKSFPEALRAETLIQYSRLGSGFTVCILLIGNQIKLGASRCSNRDRPNRIKGEMLSLKKSSDI